MVRTLGANPKKPLLAAVVALGLFLSATAAIAQPAARYTATEWADLDRAANDLGLDRNEFATISVGVHHFLLGIGGRLDTPDGGCASVTSSPADRSTATVELAPNAHRSLEIVKRYYCLDDEAAIRVSTTLLVFLVSLRGPKTPEAPTTTTTLASTPSVEPSMPIESEVLGVVEEQPEAGIDVDASVYADWLLELQQPNGALPLHEDARRIEPYVSAWGAWGLTTTGRPQDLDAAWRWLAWFRDAQRTDGSVPETERIDGVWTDTGTYDSLDGTTSLWALSLLGAHRADAARSDLQLHTASVERSIEALVGLQQPDGLVWAKPDWPVKLLMGQAEAYAGLLALSELAIELGRPDLQQQAEEAASRIRAGLAALWNEKTDSYDWALHSNGVREATDWNVLYPDATSQLWTVAFDLAPPSQQATIEARFGEAQPQWSNPAATALIDDTEAGLAAVGYWPALGLTATTAGETGLDAYHSIDNAARDAQLAWPFHAGNAGQMLLLAEHLREG